ncbi:hypothetical protein [Pseudomonas sp. GL-R-19]|uniref:hypothetical protein n=1 Tax=Pseudomonas sp. GL-R-19 TaxID=2832391 RepID=UPI001CBB5DA3|nr:hypothetical protein [Pseudomonas sp. GL-R-19]
MTTEQNAATAASNPWEQATLFINGKKVEWGVGPVFIRGEENEVTVAAPPEIAGAINLGLVEGGGLNIVASPNFGDWVVPVNGQFHWKITPDAGKSGRITLVFFSREVLAPWEHQSLVISNNLVDEADALIDGEVFPEGFVFRLGEKKPVSLRVKDGSPLAAVPLKLTYRVVEGDDLQLVSEPDFGVPLTDYKWDVMGLTGNGTFKLGVEADGMSSVLYMPDCRMTSDDEDEPLIILFDGKQVRYNDIFLVPDNSQHTVTIKHGKLKPREATVLYFGPSTVSPDAWVQQVIDPVHGATWQVKFIHSESGPRPAMFIFGGGNEQTGLDEYTRFFLAKNADGAESAATPYSK